ncbi:uncharacterized protein LOC143857564 [Tasmannia lanceolata]|uniref:uncharacterized protein LOC143857564 n=1 Tax=Tasmannia lanceolata TaxID=3420 RepID=UPI0040638B4C
MLQLNESPDILIWCPSPSSTFSTNSAWIVNRTRDSHVSWAAPTWGSIPPKISCFLWKFFQEAIATDERIKSKHIQAPSKCVCCSIHKDETMNHLFIEGELARSICSEFANLWNFNLIQFQSIKTRIISWWKAGTKRKTQAAHLFSLTTPIIAWKIWKERCSRRMEGKSNPTNRIISTISEGIRNLDCSHSPLKEPNLLEVLSLSQLRISPCRPRIQKDCWILWKRPPKGTLKLNIMELRRGTLEKQVEKELFEMKNQRLS